MICYALMCQFIHSARQMKHPNTSKYPRVPRVPRPLPPPQTNPNIERKKTAPSWNYFHVTHCSVNAMTRRCHSESSHQPLRPESTPLIGGQLVLLKGDWQTENCTLRFHPSFVAVGLPLVRRPPWARDRQRLYPLAVCWAGGQIEEGWRRWGGGGLVGDNPTFEPPWGKSNHAILREKQEWIS